MIRASEVKVGMTIRSDGIPHYPSSREWSLVTAIRDSVLSAGDVKFMELVFGNGYTYMFRVGSIADEPVWIVREGTPTVEERLVDLEKKVNRILEHFPIHEPGIVIGGGPVEDRLYKSSELKQGMVVRKIREDGEVVGKWDRVVRVYGVNLHVWRVILGDSEPYSFSPEINDHAIWEVRHV